ncbi:DUF6478 family protein [Cereibacter sphaeroides]|uniref:DUF6478 family protein n=1 Tax=Cereibacter sphaeroides TaxID=1063 RepID=UPI001F220E30|nr:DUF6478 family protein [Cereibacter sphaeroides]MCE6968535.1 DUF6478 family protein [Cereibacter sphaeroides]
MSRRLRSLMGRLFHRAVLRRWSRAADSAAAIDLGTLRRQRAQARTLRRQLDRLLHTAENRLALPLIGSKAMRRPMGTDWTWRPDLWRGPIATPGIAAAPRRAEIAAGTTLFHDCPEAEITVRQIRNTREADLAPYGLRLDVFRFGGSFLSVVLDLPDEAVQGLQLRHVIRLEVTAECERPLRVFARLNVRHGPNTEEIVQGIAVDGSESAAEFDLACTRMVEKRVEKIWVDLILDRPEMNQIILRDVTLSRRPRAEL